MSLLTGEPFEYLLSQINSYSHRSCTILQLMCDECGAETAYYAAFVLVCLEASVNETPTKPLGSYRAEDFQDFTFFEKAQGDDRALALFDDLLRTYQADRQDERAHYQRWYALFLLLRTHLSIIYAIRVFFMMICRAFAYY